MINGPQLTKWVPLMALFGLIVGIGIIRLRERGWVFPGPVKNRIPDAPPEPMPADEHSSSAV